VRQVAAFARRLQIRWIDFALALGLTLWAAFEGSGRDSAGFSPAVFLTTVPLLVRRRWPVAVMVLAMIGFGIAEQATGLAALLGGLTAVLSVGLYSRHQNVAWVVVLAAATFIAVAFGHGSTTTSTLPVPGVLLPFLLIGAAYLAGREIGNRQKQLAAERERAEELRRESEAAQHAAALAERSRIARELHDVVAHSVSVMVVQAGAARQVLTEKPDAARESLVNVETVGHEAMAELRRLLGVLGENGAEPAPLAPQPGLEKVPALIQRMTEAGLPVTFRIEGPKITLPADLEAAAYRIVQEALTNALKYGGGAPTDVLVRYGTEALDLEVVDEGEVSVPSDAIGRGLIGMRERVAIFGGSIEAGRRPSRGYAVRAHLPLGTKPGDSAPD
jgi:signal transduction histidine kinase